MPPVNDIKCDFDLEVKFGSGPPDGAHYKFICTWITLVGDT